MCVAEPFLCFFLPIKLHFESNLCWMYLFGVSTETIWPASKLQNPDPSFLALWS